MSCIITKIIKSTKGKHKKAAKLRDVGSTINYIVDAENHGDKIHENMIFALNMDTEDESIESWKEEIKQHHKQFKQDRGKGEPTGHYIISYKEEKGEGLSLEKIKAHVQIKLHHLGYDNHKAVCAVHANTDHIHIHVALDKVSPNKKNGKCYIPNNVGTVIHHDKKNNRNIRHEVLCQHAAMYDICSLEGWSTDHCLVDNLGQKLKNIKKSLPKNSIKEELRTGEKSTQRIIFETLYKHAAPKTSEQFASVFQKLGESGIGYEIKYNKDKEIKGFVYTKDGKSLASSDCPSGWEHKNILPFITQTSQQNVKFLDKDRKSFLYEAFAKAKKNDTDYTNLGNYLKEHDYGISNGRVHHELGSCKFSEIYREFSSTKLEKSFADNLAKKKLSLQKGETPAQHAQRNLLYFTNKHKETPTNNTKTKDYLQKNINYWQNKKDFAQITDAMFNSCKSIKNIGETRQNIEKIYVEAKNSGKFNDNQTEYLNKLYEKQLSYVDKWAKRKEKQELEREKRQQAYIRKRNKFMKQKAKRRLINKLKRLPEKFVKKLIKFIFGIKSSIPRNFETQADIIKNFHIINFNQPFNLKVLKNGEVTEKYFENFGDMAKFIIQAKIENPYMEFELLKWNDLNDVYANLRIYDSDSYPYFIQFVNENGETVEKKFESKQELAQFVLKTKMDNPNISFSYIRNKLYEERSPLYVNEKNRQRDILNMYIPLYVERKKQEQEQKHNNNLAITM